MTIETAKGFDLGNLTAKQTDQANKFLDMLLAGKAVGHSDFPEMQEAEFYEMADAMLAAVNH